MEYSRRKSLNSLFSCSVGALIHILVTHQHHKIFLAAVFPPSHCSPAQVELIPFPRRTSCFHQLHFINLISAGSRAGCAWQILSEKGSGNCSFCSVPVLVTDGHTECLKCSGPLHDPEAYEQQTLPAFLLSINLKCLLELLFFSPCVSGVFCWVCTFLKRSLSPFFFFLLKKVSRCSCRLAEESANCCCRLVNKFIFAWEWHIWPRAEILGVCGPCEGWQILPWKKIAFGSVINFILIAGRTSQFLIFFFVFWFFLNWWSSIISQSCDSSRAALKRWWGSGQFIYGFSLLHLSSCKRGKLVYEAHWNFMDYSPWFRVAWLTCRVCCFIPCIFIHKTCKSKLLVQQKW